MAEDDTVYVCIGRDQNTYYTHGFSYLGPGMMRTTEHWQLGFKALGDHTKAHDPDIWKIIGFLIPLEADDG